MTEWVTLLEKTFKDSVEIKILRFVVTSPFDNTITQIKDGAGVSRTAVRYLIKKKILTKTRRDKKSVYYKLNKNIT